MARTSRAQAATTRERILSTARSLMAKHGMEAVGLETVAREAGVTRGAVYHHFGSRHGMVLAVHARVQEEVAAAADGVIAVESVAATQALLSGAMNEAALRAASLGDPQRGVEEEWSVLRRMLAALRA